MIPAFGTGRIHLLGICGTAMASLAGLLQSKGLRVSGSDENAYPPMSEQLEGLGVTVKTPYRAENLDEDIDLVVVGNALSRGNPELEAMLNRGLAYASMPEVLKEVFLRHRTPVVIAGTHGKTSTSSLVAWLLESGGLSPGYLIGGVPSNFPHSYALGEGEAFVVEGDEYDTAYFDKGPKFLHYLPEVAVLGNVEFDHADIYRDLESVIQAFRLYVNLVPGNGLLILGAESSHAVEAAGGAFCSVETFSAEGDADWTARVSESDAGGTRVAIRWRGEVFTTAKGAFWGASGVRNVLAACAVARRFGLSAEAIADGLERFRGVRRRMEVRGEVGGVTVVDDFAHHHTAVKETILAARKRFPGRRLRAVFEPRSFTARSNRFQRELAEALAMADEAVISRVFRSHRLPEEDELSEEQLVGDVAARGTAASFIEETDEIVENLSETAADGDVFLIMSNGGFGGIHRKLLAKLAAEVS